MLLQIKGEEAKDEKEEEGEGYREGGSEEIQERGAPPPSSPSCAVDFRRVSSAHYPSSRNVSATPTREKSATGLAESAMREDGRRGAAGAIGEASPV